MKGKSLLVAFGGGDLPASLGYDATLAGAELAALIEPGSIYEATALLEELPHLALTDGHLVSKALVYKGYELWWLHYNNLFFYFCLPYTQYKKLLEYLVQFEHVTLHSPPFPALFEAYMRSYGVKVRIIQAPGRNPLPFGIVLQGLLTLLYLPALIILRRSTMIFTGDKFEKGRDHDFRLRYIYEELRARKIPFVEVIRGLERSPDIIAHAWHRARPVFYTEPITFLARGLSIFAGKRIVLEFAPTHDPLARFKQEISIQYLKTVKTDIIAIQLMRIALRLLGIRAAYITVALERNFATVLACKLENVPIVGILHGVSSRYYNGYDFLPGFTGAKRITVDTYGVWSQWWKDYYLKNGNAYAPEQLVVSGPMRPQTRLEAAPRKSGPLRVLYVAEQLGVPQETLPFLEQLMKAQPIDLYIKFRSSGDGFEGWLQKYRPDVLEHFDNEHTFRGTMQEAIEQCDVVVGSHSTAVLESLLQQKPCIFYDTKKWGDYFDLRSLDGPHRLIAATPEELVELIVCSSEIPAAFLRELQERYFGDPQKNGSKWVVNQLERLA